MYGAALIISFLDYFTARRDVRFKDNDGPDPVVNTYDNCRCVWLLSGAIWRAGAVQLLTYYVTIVSDVIR